VVCDIIGIVLTSSSSTPKGRATEKHKSWRVLATFDQSERSDHQPTGSTISWTSPGFKPTGPGFGPLEWTGWAFGLNRFNHQKRCPKASQPNQQGDSTHQAESLPKASHPVTEGNKPPVKAASSFGGKPKCDSKPLKGLSTPPLVETPADSSTGLSSKRVETLPLEDSPPRSQPKKRSRVETPPLEDSPPRSRNRWPMMSVPGRSKPPPKQASGAPLQLWTHMPRQRKQANKPVVGQPSAQSGKAEGQDARGLTSATQGKARSKEPSKTYATAAILPPPPPFIDRFRWGQKCPPEYLAMLERNHKESQSGKPEPNLFEAP